MSVQPIDPVSDSRIQHKTAKLNGYTYHYLYAVPQSGKWSETVFLVRLIYLPPALCRRLACQWLDDGADNG